MQKYLSILRNSPFFKGLTDNEILSIMNCVNATTISKKRDSYIFRAGDITEVMGLVVSGCVLIIQEDIWGHRNILSKCHAGDFFGEPYAASQRAVLNISVVADEDCEIILLNVKRLLITCPTACEHHQKLIRNLVSVLANKILILNDKITHVGKRTTRDKLLSYLSAESIRHSSLSFDIPFDRQQLADYLCIDRAAMSTEISKLQKEGFIKTNRNHFELTVFKDADPRMPRHSCCEVRVMQLHDILLLRTSAILPEAISDGGLAPTTDTSLFLTTYRGGSHLPTDITQGKQ